MKKKIALLITLAILILAIAWLLRPALESAPEESTAPTEYQTDPANTETWSAFQDPAESVSQHEDDRELESVVPSGDQAHQNESEKETEDKKDPARSPVQTVRPIPGISRRSPMKPSSLQRILRRHLRRKPNLLRQYRLKRSLTPQNLKRQNLQSLKSPMHSSGRWLPMQPSTSMPIAVPRVRCCRA